MDNLENYEIEEESQRLTLKTLKTENMSPNYLSWLQNHDVLQYLEIRHSTQTQETIENFVNNMLASQDNLLLGMFTKDDSKHIGNIKLGPVNWRYGHADIGLMIGDENNWGKGYATEAIDNLCNIAFNTIGLRRVQAGAYASNKGSIKAFMRAGFKEEGIKKGYWLYNDEPEDEIFFAKLAGQ